MDGMNMKRTKIAQVVLAQYGAIQTHFVHMRMTTYMLAGGSMLTVKVV
jgi:hypothetical protein